MNNRIIVRTTANVSYVGIACHTTNFSSEGIAITPNTNLKMQIFVPREEVLEIVEEGSIYSFEEYMK